MTLWHEWVEVNKSKQQHSPMQNYIGAIHRVHKDKGFGHHDEVRKSLLDFFKNCGFLR